MCAGQGRGCFLMRAGFQGKAGSGSSGPSQESIHEHQGHKPGRLETIVKEQHEMQEREKREAGTMMVLYIHAIL